MKKLLSRISFIRYYLLGKEYSKNPPKIESLNNIVSNLKITNAHVICKSNDEITNNMVISTLPHYLQRYNNSASYHIDIEKKITNINDKGLINKYNISRTDGKPISPENEYFVLKLKGSGDEEHINASQSAILAYADAICHHLPELSKDIFKKYGNNVMKSEYSNDTHQLFDDKTKYNIDCPRLGLDIDVYAGDRVESRVKISKLRWHYVMNKEKYDVIIGIFIGIIVGIVLICLLLSLKQDLT